MRRVVDRNVVMRRMTVYLPLLKYIVTRDLRFPDMLRSVDGLLVTYVSGQPIGLISKGQAIHFRCQVLQHSETVHFTDTVCFFSIRFSPSTKNIPPNNILPLVFVI